MISNVQNGLKSSTVLRYLEDKVAWPHILASSGCGGKFMQPVVSNLLLSAIYIVQEWVTQQDLT